ncbi:hypothetical protein [Pseudoalteromonas umbrosa]|uniref:hypothetical protein n=1 Tax=Pseudoalteromonas umbrosa TaxID=3048489 RepID=UPI0024C2BE36|nr:hypothetical protein [Pseudoalteromonas sp. B95]MDK1288858.1 hypothetical protein [Pseudoalteromonas sp. B95]
MTMINQYRKLADELARDVSSQNGSGLVKQLIQTGLLQVPTQAVNNLNRIQTEDRVGIWKINAENEEYVRDQSTSKDWPFWSALAGFKKQKTGKRFLFLGESVARGMFYDPIYTPAKVLESLLNTQLDEDVEVLDFAKTNASFETLVEVAQGAKCLDADGVIIFAGNNWLKGEGYLKSFEDALALSSEYKEQGPAAIKDAIERGIAKNIESLVDTLEETFTSQGVPLYWVLPEFNLTGWKEITQYPPSSIASTDQPLWHELRDEAMQLIEQGQFEASLDVIKKMEQGDGGLAAQTQYIAAQAYKQIGDDKAYKEALERARDAVLLNTQMRLVPRITNHIKQTLTTELSRVEAHIIDLAKVFNDSLDLPVAGNEVFLDYCHLSSTGIRVSMAALAQRISHQVQGDDVHIAFESALAPCADTESSAHLLAAIHNAHWGQDIDCVEYYCKKAVQYNASIVDTMTMLMEVQNVNVPTWMNKPTSELLEKACTQIQRYITSMEFKCLDTTLCDGFVKAAQEVGQDISAQLLELQIQQHAVEVKGQHDLLDPYYHVDAFCNTQMVEGVSKFDYYNALSPVSEFDFVSKGERHLSLNITCSSKLANKGVTAAVQVKVNGESVGKIEVGQTWSTAQLDIDAMYIRSGVNRLTLEWPEEHRINTGVIEDNCAMLQARQLPILSPVFGEIYSMTLA